MFDIFGAGGGGGGGGGGGKGGRAAGRGGAGARKGPGGRAFRPGTQVRISRGEGIKGRRGEVLQVRGSAKTGDRAYRVRINIRNGRPRTRWISDADVKSVG